MASVVNAESGNQDVPEVRLDGRDMDKYSSVVGSDSEIDESQED